MNTTEEIKQVELVAAGVELAAAGGAGGVPPAVHIGILGATDAGKTTLLQAVFADMAIVYGDDTVVVPPAHATGTDKTPGRPVFFLTPGLRRAPPPG